MPSGASARSYGRHFNEVAEDYDRHRPTYPDMLIDRACEAAELTGGDEVLEIGCGTGQLTRSLLARGLRVTAIEPGAQLIALAREQLDGMGDVQFVNERLEDAVLPKAHYAAVFSASAIHWIDPDVSWRKLSEALVDGGGLALISYFGLEDPWSLEDQRAMRAATATAAPSFSAEWRAYRDLEDTLAGVEARRDNVSEVWAWLGGYPIGRSCAARLFDDADIVALPAHLEHSADELNALLRTMSFWARLGPGERDALYAANQALYQRLGRRIRSSTVACLVTARRRSRT